MTPLLTLPLEAPAAEGLLVEPEEARSILRPQKDDRYGFGFSLSPYRGCAHACAYCYVREYPHPLHPPSAWGAWASPKLNAPELLWAQRHRLHGQTVFLASATDPYQPLERQYRLTRACLEVLQACPTTRVMVHTRSPLVLQDLELLRGFHGRLSVHLSIPTDDDTVRQVVEPKAPAIPSRWVTVERLAAAGVPVGISVAPLLPMVDPEGFARRARQSGAASAWVGALRLLKDDPFSDVLARRHWLKALDPDYVAEVREVLRTAFPVPPARCGVAPGGRSRRVLLSPPRRPEARQPSLFEGF